MSMSALSKIPIFFLADRVSLHRDPCPVVQGLLKSFVRCAALGDPAAAAGAEGDGCHAAKASQGAEVSILDGFGGFAQQCCQHARSHARHGAQDRGIASRYGIDHGRFFRMVEGFQLAFDLSASVGEQLVDQDQLFNGDADLCNRRGHGAGGRPASPIVAVVEAVVRH